MKRHISILSIAAILSAPVIAQQAPTSGSTGATAQSAETRRGVPGVDVDVGRNASSRGLPGVEMNVGRDGDQNNVNTRSLGAGPRTNADGSMRPMRRDRN